MSFLGNLYASIGLDTKGLRKGATEAKKAVTGIETSMAGLSKSVISVKGLFLGLGGVMAGRFAKDLWDTQIMIDQMNRAFGTIAGSVDGAGTMLEDIRGITYRLGQEFYSATDAFKWIAAAAKDTALEGEGVRDVFLGVSEAGTALGLSNVQVKMSLYAISQMISKGTVNAEELRQQLGERLPGAYQAMARALGVTTAELNKMLEQGKIIATEALPKLSAELHRLYAADAMKAADKPIGVLNRFKTAWIDLKREISSGEFLSVAADSLRSFTDVLSDGEFLSSLRYITNQVAEITSWLIKMTAISLKPVVDSVADLVSNMKSTPDPRELAKSYSESNNAIANFFMSIGHASDKSLKKFRENEKERRKILNEALMSVPMGESGPSGENYRTFTDPNRMNIFGGMEYDTGLDLKALEDEQKKFSKVDKALKAFFKDIESEAKYLRISLDHEMKNIDDVLSNFFGRMDAMVPKVQDMRKELGADLFKKWLQDSSEANTKLLREDRALELSRREVIKDHVDFWLLKEKEKAEVASRSAQQVYLIDRSLGQKIKDDLDLDLGSMEEAFSGWATSYASELNDMLWESEFTFSAILESFGKMITQMLIQSSMADFSKMLFGDTKSGVDGLFGFLGSLFSTGSSGGILTADQVALQTGAGLKFEGGGHLGEKVLGIGATSGRSYEFHNNETVIPDAILNSINKNSGQGNLNITINENQKETAVHDEMVGDMRNIVIDIVSKEANRNPWFLRKR
jgi:tape measure domain-containing protein